MRKVIYFCDHCEKEFGDKEHLSFQFGNQCGWVKPNVHGNWAHFNRISGIKQFCNTKCLGAFFKNLKKKKK